MGHQMVEKDIGDTYELDLLINLKNNVLLF